MKIKLRRIILVSSIMLILIALIPYCVSLGKVISSTARLSEQKVELEQNFQENLLDMIVSQARLRADEFKSSIALYDSIYNPDWFQHEGSIYTFHSKSTNEYLDIDLAVYTIEEGVDNLYDVYDTNHNLIYQGLAAEWNKVELDNFLNIAIRNTRLFGTEGDPIVIDQRTKEILADDSYNCRDVEEVLGDDGRRYMSLDYLHPENMNPEGTEWVIENVLTWDNDELWFYFFTAPYITLADIENGDAFDFEKYPLQASNNIGREIGYTVIVEIRNTYGVVLPLRAMFGAQEYEFMNYFSEMLDTYDNIETLVEGYELRSILLPLVGLILIILLLLIIYVIFPQFKWVTKIEHTEIDFVKLEEELNERLQR